MKRRFRIGSTSYVYPDDILPNVRKLAPLVDDVELVLFEVDDYGANLPDSAAIGELQALAGANDLTFTVHLPLDLSFDNANSFDKARRAIDATRGLDPYGFVMHLDGRVLAGHPSSEKIAEWQVQATHALARIVDWVGDPALVCVENVEGWDPDYFRDVVEDCRVSRCIDIGHFWLQKLDPLEHLADHLTRTRVIHLHGVGSRDHQSLRNVARDQLQPAVNALLRGDYAGLVTLEVFGVDDFFSSYDVLQEALASGEDR